MAHGVYGRDTQNVLEHVVRVHERGLGNASPPDLSLVEEIAQV